MNITKRLILGYGIIIILLAGLTGHFTFSLMDRMSELNDRIVSNIGANQDQVSRLEVSLFQLNDAIYNFYSVLSPESLSDFVDALQQVFINLVGIRTAHADPELTVIIEPAEKQLQLQIQIMQELQRDAGSGDLKSNKDIKAFSPQTLIAEINPAGLISNIQRSFHGKMLQEKLLSVQIRQNAYLYLGIIFLIAVIVGLGIGIYLSRSITTTIRRSSNQLSAVSDEILMTSEEESNTSVEQSSEINQASGTLQGLSVTASEIDKSTSDVTNLVKKTAEQMTKLKETTEKIMKIASLIEEISQQINILSLNASIEAFRAGDQGKGFSAVAMEIRKLAENTRTSTEGISSLVNDIYESTGITADSMEEAVKRVNKIAQFVNQQTADTDQISEAVAKINQNMQNSLENIQKTKSAAEELRQVALKLRALI